MSERQVLLSIVNHLKDQPKCHFIKTHGDIYLPIGTPDLLCVKDGVPYMIEVKRPGGKVSDIQSIQLDRWMQAGAVTGVASSLDEALDLLNDPA